MGTYKRIITVDDEIQAQRAVKGLVYLIDDDCDVLVSLSQLIEYEGYACKKFLSVDLFFAQLKQPRFEGPRCILSDMSMPGKTGLVLQEMLPKDSDMPLIFITGIGDIDQAAQAFRRGALHFLTKPISDTDLFAVLKEAMQVSACRQELYVKREKKSALIARLTPRERELAKMLPEGLSIKEMAKEMGISDRAVKLYKKNLMDKLEIKSVFDLAKFQIDGLL